MIDVDLTVSKTELENSLRVFMRSVNKLAHEKGFWPDGWEAQFPAKIALIHEEVSEALHTFRDWVDFAKPPAQSAKIPYTHMTEELADIVIRVLDLAQELGVDLPGAMLAKHEFNKTREPRHGKRF